MKIYNFVLLQVFLLFLCVRCVFSDPLPQSVTDTLEQREQHLSTATLIWQTTDSSVVPGRTESNIASMQQSIRQQLPGQMRRRGVTDEQYIQKFVQHQVQELPSLMSGYSVQSTSAWEFDHSGKELLVKGSMQYGPDFVGEYRHYFLGNAGLIINDNSRAKDGKNVHSLDPIVWSSPGESMRFRAPTRTGLNLSPEELSLLTELNPLTLYGVQWKVSEVTPKAWVLDAQVTQGDGAPFSIRLTLDKDKNGSPSHILVQGIQWTADLRVLSFRKHQGFWIADKVVADSISPGFYRERQFWTLADLTSPRPINVAVSKQSGVHDYRLLSGELSVSSIMNAESHRDPNIVYYKWNGQFPDLNKLRSLRQQQHPGEAAPDPSSSGPTSPGSGAPASASSMIGPALPFAGGLLCIVGGVWMFKLRHAK